MNNSSTKWVELNALSCFISASAKWLNRNSFACKTIARYMHFIYMHFIYIYERMYLRMYLRMCVCVFQEERECFVVRACWRVYQLFKFRSLCNTVHDWKDCSTTTTIPSHCLYTKLCRSLCVRTRETRIESNHIRIFLFYFSLFYSTYCPSSHEYFE